MYVIRDRDECAVIIGVDSWCDHLTLPTKIVSFCYFLSYSGHSYYFVCHLLIATRLICFETMYFFISIMNFKYLLISIRYIRRAKIFAFFLIKMILSIIIDYQSTRLVFNETRENDWKKV